MDSQETQHQPLTDETLHTVLKSELVDAVSFIDSEIGPERAKLTKAYNGEAYGDEKDGRSQIVVRDVRDTVHSLLPDLLRMFMGPDHVVEFMPNGAEDVALAEQATDYIEHIIKNDNPGFSIFLSTFKDALARSMGVVKYWWDESVEVSKDHMSGLDEEALQTLQSMAQAEGAEVMVSQDQGTGLFDAEVRHKTSAGRAKIAAVPPEELVINRDARSVSSARLIAHRAMVTASDLVALGYDPDFIQEHVGSSSLDTNAEALARVGNKFMNGQQNEADPATRRILYTEGYFRADRDGDGIAELLKFCTIGDNHEVADIQEASFPKFAIFCADPEPHTFFGSSPGEQVQDIQRVKTVVTRNMLDSLAMTVHPRTAVVMGQANIDDVLNTEVGTVIRENVSGAVRQLETPFVGQAALGVLSYMDDVKQDRVGVSRAASGLDPESMQSTTKAAVAATVSASNKHSEMTARILAETGMRDLFRGLLKLVVENQQKARVIRLRGKWVPMDPAGWNADMDLHVNIAVGEETKLQQIGTLKDIIAQQGLLLQTLGPNNPLVSIVEYRYALAKAIELSGFKDSARFFKEITPEAAQQFAQQAAQSAQQAPSDGGASALAAVQVKQIQADMMVKHAEFTLKQQQNDADNTFKQTKLQQDAANDQRQYDLKMRELQLKEMEYKLELARATADHQLKTRQVDVQAAQATRLPVAA